MARNDGIRPSTSERNAEARSRIPRQAGETVRAALEKALDALEEKLDALVKVARSAPPEQAERANLKVFELRALLYGGPFDPEDTKLPHPDHPEFHPMLHTWEGLCGLVRHAMRREGCLRIVEKPCPPAVVKRMLGLPDHDGAAAKLALGVTSLHDNEGVACFAPAICDRLDKTGVEAHDDGMLTALAFVMDRWVPKDIEPQPPGPGLMIPRFQKTEDAEAMKLPGFMAASPMDGQLPLFDDQPAPWGCPSWLLSLYDQAGGEAKSPKSRHRGAPWDLRLFVGALLSVPVDERDGRDKRFAISAGDLAEWLHPGGWDRSNRRRDWEAFRATLRSLDRLRILYRVRSCEDIEACVQCRERGGHLVQLRTVDVPCLPEKWDRGRTPVVFRVSIPRSAARGATVDWDRLVRYGVESAVLYRAYLSVSAVLDYTARAGHPITKTIGAPVLNQAGSPIFRKGHIVRDKTRSVENPAQRYVKFLSDDELRQLVGLKAATPANRMRAREAIERLALDEVIDIEQRSDGTVRFFGPRATPRAKPIPC